MRVSGNTKKDPNKWNDIDNFRSITLLKAGLLAKRFVFVIGKAQTRAAVPDRSVYDNLLLMRYIIVRVVKGLRGDGALIHIDQRKAFDMVKHCYLKAVLIASGFSPVFRGWNTALYSGIHSVARINGHVSKRFSIKRSVH